MKLGAFEFILYVEDQQVSTRFYEQLLNRTADLNVPGMTEFNLSPELKLGLMPNKGIAKILQDQLPHPSDGSGIPRCELYFMVENLETDFASACELGKLISPLENRDWGHRVGYLADPDGHVVALAAEL